jgi:hypothetical protein
MKQDFKKKYPNATMSKFNFQVVFAKDGTVLTRVILFKVTDLDYYNITSEAFRNNPKWTKFLYWADGWRNITTNAAFDPNKDFKMDAHSFKVYVSETEGFVTKLDPIKPKNSNLVPRASRELKAAA